MVTSASIVVAAGDEIDARVYYPATSLMRKARRRQ
jgi:hypothetical protein